MRRAGRTAPFAGLADAGRCLLADRPRVGGHARIARPVEPGVRRRAEMRQCPGPMGRRPGPRPGRLPPLVSPERLVRGGRGRPRDLTRRTRHLPGPDGEPGGLGSNDRIGDPLRGGVGNPQPQRLPPLHRLHPGDEPQLADGLVLIENLARYERSLPHRSRRRRSSLRSGRRSPSSPGRSPFTRARRRRATLGCAKGQRLVDGWDATVFDTDIPPDLALADKIHVRPEPGARSVSVSISTTATLPRARKRRFSSECAAPRPEARVLQEPRPENARGEGCPDHRHSRREREPVRERPFLVPPVEGGPEAVVDARGLRARFGHRTPGRPSSGPAASSSADPGGTSPCRSPRNEPCRWAFRTRSRRSGCRPPSPSGRPRSGCSCRDPAHRRRAARSPPVRRRPPLGEPACTRPST